MAANLDLPRGDGDSLITVFVCLVRSNQDADGHWTPYAHAVANTLPQYNSQSPIKSCRNWLTRAGLNGCLVAGGHVK